MRWRSREAERAQKRRADAARTARCWVCGWAMHPVLITMGYASHPCCDPAERPVPPEKRTYGTV